MHGEVHAWQMTEEERLAYIEKYPIRPEKQPKGSTFVYTQEEFRNKQDKAIKSRWGATGYQ